MEKKTIVPKLNKKQKIERKYYLIDVKGKVLGRAATKIAKLLIGKDIPMFTPNVDQGSYVVVVNTNFVVLTRQKEEKKVYYRHSGFPGGLKEIPFKQQMLKDSTKVIYSAVKGMLPKNKFQSGRLGRLFLYKTETHDKDAQKPQLIKI